MARVPGPHRDDDTLLFGIMLGVLAFWLFAQTTLNIAPAMAADLEVATNVMNIAVSITALFSGIFIVVVGGLADRVGRVKILMWGFILSIFASAAVSVAGMPMVRGTPESKAAAEKDYRFDTMGVLTFMVTMVALQVLAILVSMMLVQLGGGLSAQEAGMPTLGYAIAIVTFIRGGRSLSRSSPRASR